ncbi:Clavaminate synthase-like protein [Acephala macrosclerotiorum]|nr:Clavaminate synthase-like protein [Acephala macrosclerotiorum]
MSAPPILDFSPFYGNGSAAKAKLVQQVKDCCLHNGFFQIVGHQVPSKLQTKIFECSKAFFNLPLEEKSKLSKGTKNFSTSANLTIFRAQHLESRSRAERGILHRRRPPNHTPLLSQKKINSGPNFWPRALSPSPVSVEEFKDTTMSYYHHVVSLAKDILKVLALTLDLDEEWFGEFVQGASNDRYISNLHRVINKSDKERYSVPVFFSGNPDYTISCLPNCTAEGQKPKYPPITVADCVEGSYKESYGRAAAHKAEQEQKAKGLVT